MTSSVKLTLMIFFAGMGIYAIVLFTDLWPASRLLRGIQRCQDP